MKSDLEKITNSTWFQSMYALIMWLRGVSRSCWRQVSVTEKVFRLVSIFSSTFVSLFYEPPKQYYFSSTILSIFFCFPMRHLFFCRPFSSMYLQSQPAPPWSYLCRQSSHLNYTIIKAATCQPIPHSRVILLTCLQIISRVQNFFFCHPLNWSSFLSCFYHVAHLHCASSSASFSIGVYFSVSS